MYTVKLFVSLFIFLQLQLIDPLLNKIHKLTVCPFLKYEQSFCIRPITTCYCLGT